MNEQIGQFYLWRHSTEGSFQRVGALGVSQLSTGKLQGIEFAYTSEYVNDPTAVSLDPIHAPLKTGSTVYPTSGHDLPGFIDDCVPDAWGKKVIAMRHKRRHLDTLTLLASLTGATIGAIHIRSINDGQPEHVECIALEKAKIIAEAIWNGDDEALAESPESLNLLLTSGSGAGGARPKLLVQHEGEQWLAKFNRSQDPFDNGAAEWAAMTVARNAGLNVPDVQLHQVGSRRCLLVKRFDVGSDNRRAHLLTINALLKNPHNQEDPSFGNYEDIAALIRKISAYPEADLNQLYGQALLNSTIKNTDDHLRNFSFIHQIGGWRLTPAYDIVPGDTVGAYHQVSLGGNPFWSGPDQPTSVIKALKINVKAGEEIASDIIDAMKLWPELLAQGGVKEPWLGKLANSRRSPKGG